MESLTGMSPEARQAHAEYEKTVGVPRACRSWNPRTLRYEPVVTVDIGVTGAPTATGKRSAWVQPAAGDEQLGRETRPNTHRKRMIATRRRMAEYIHEYGPQSAYSLSKEIGCDGKTAKSYLNRYNEFVVVVQGGGRRATLYDVDWPLHISLVENS